MGNAESVGLTPGTQFSAAFEVDDIKAMREKLVAQAVTVTEVMDFPACQTCFVSDADENRFALHQRKSS